MSIQEEVFQFVARRGYVEGWSAREFLARQLAKLQEELGELTELCLTPSFTNFLDSDIRIAAEIAKDRFDNAPKDWWKKASCAKHEDAPQLQRELADIQVVVFCMAEIIKKLTGKDFDVVEWARRKAEDDIDRGVRSI